MIPSNTSLTARLEVIILDMIWKVCDLCLSDLDSVFLALCDWSNVAMKEIIKTKSIARRLVFGQPTEGFTGCLFGRDFIKLNRGRECIYIRSNDLTHASVTVYYGVMPPKLLEVQVDVGSVD